MRDAQAHYIRKNESSRIPERYVILDCEALRNKSKSGEVQTWALSVSRFLTFTKTGKVIQSTCRFDTPMELWQAVSDFTRCKRRTVLYAHNLNYDLRISQCLTFLPKLGWELQDIRLDGRGSWSRWTRQSASLLLCDSASIFPVKIAELATVLGMVKLPLPPCSEREALYKRCERDVEILATGIIEYIKWLRTGVCGNWQMTGASQSWAHYRHSLMPYPILVHEHEEVLAAERAAMHTGRAEAWHWGQISREKIWEYDWSNSYPRIARDCELPQAYFGTISKPSIERLETLWQSYCVLAECEVTTDVPCVPTSHEGRIIWPTGTFVTTLWDPELRELRKAKATIRVLRAWLYKRLPILRDWSEWIISSLYDQTGIVEQWKKLILKHWSRSLIGRFGMRYKRWEEFATLKESRISIGIFHNRDDSSTSEIMQIGTKLFKLTDYQEIGDGCPQITGYIMSEARAKLWRVSSAIGQRDILYMDTDSIVVSQTGHKYITDQREMGDYAGLRTKATYHNARIYGPRSAIFGGKPCVSGMAKDSEKISQDHWKSEYWQSARGSIAKGEPNAVVVSYRNFTLRYNERRRAFSANGETVPYVLPAYIPGANYIRPKTRMGWAILNGYPAMLSRSTAIKSSTRFERQTL